MLPDLPELWLVREQSLGLMTSQLQQLTAEHFRTHDERDWKPYENLGGVALLSIRGLLLKRSWWWGATYSYDAIADAVRQALRDPTVQTIVLDIDSPGGGVYGVADCSDVIFEARKQKRIIAVANDLCTSGALWLGTSATELVATQTADLGSIGVYRVRYDYSAANKSRGVRVVLFRAGEQKAFGHPDLKITPEELRVGQEQVNATYETFIAAVSRNRQVPIERVRSDWADAREFRGAAAVSVGLADRVASLDQVLADLLGRDVITGDVTNGRSDHQTSHPQSGVPRAAGCRWIGRFRSS